jgi:hypothetical protein
MSLPSPSVAQQDKNDGSIACERHKANLADAWKYVIAVVNGRLSDPEDEVVDNNIKKAVDDALEKCKLSKEDCGLLPEDSGLRYTYYLPRAVSPRVVSIWIT